jgi:hypothetical protein
MVGFSSVIALGFVGLAMGAHPAPYHPAPYHPAPYHPAPAPYHPAPAPYHPKPAPYHPDPYAKLPPRPFAYEYGVKDEYSGAYFDKKEVQDDYGVVTGEYRVALPDGRTQIVTYHADHENGYVADVKYEGEPHYEPYHPKPAPAPYHPKPAPYHPAPAPYHPKPAPYHPKPAPVYHPKPAPYHPAPYHPAPYHL